MNEDVTPIAAKDENRLRRHLECLTALRSPTRELIEKALTEGWAAGEIASALVSLAAELFPYEDNSV